MGARRVAITGIGLVTPLGSGREKTWAAVRVGKSAIGYLSDPEFDGLEVRIGGRCSDLVDPPDSNEDRVVTLGLAAAKDAWQDARLTLQERDGHRVGCAIGCSKGGLRYLLDQHARLVRGQPLSPFVISAFLPSASNRFIGAELGLRGPSGNAVGACATGLLCVIEGVQWIQSGRCDAALVGSTDASVLPLVISGFDRLGVLSRKNDRPQEACKPFDAGRDGFAVSEGAAVLVLESLDAALQRKVHVYGEITGWATGSLAYEILALPQDGHGIASVIKAALEKAQLTPAEIDLVSAHGTGTLQNDRVETAALKQVFGPHAHRVCVSATKSILGHLLGACASAELAVGLLAMRDSFAPPTINLRTPDPQCDLDYVPNVGRPMRIRNLLKLSIGFGGHVAALVVSRSDEG
jgi:3-oxoacyl-[acyl-carrier-protein] synthase II